MPDTVEEKSIRRFSFLKKVYDDTAADIMRVVNMLSIGDGLGWDRAETTRIYNYLKAEGLVKTVAYGGSMTITHAGIVEIEKAETIPQEPTQHFPKNAINIYGNVTGAAFQVGSTNSTQTISINVTAKDVKSLTPWLNKLTENIPSLGLSEESHQAMTRSVTALENEILETEPDRGVLKIALGRVQGLLQSVGTHIGAVQLLNELPTVMHHLHL